LRKDVKNKTLIDLGAGAEHVPAVMTRRSIEFSTKVFTVALILTMLYWTFRVAQMMGIFG